MTISFKVSDKTKEKMIEHYKYMRRDKTPPYAIFQANDADTVITLYESGKVVFQGLSADIDANFWRETEVILTGKEVIEKEKKEKKEDKTKLNEEVEKAREVYKTAEDVDTLKNATENLTKVSSEIFSKLYANANPQGGADGANGSTDPNNFGDYTTK